MAETRAVQVKFHVDQDLVSRVTELMRLPSTRKELEECNPYIISGLPGSIPEEALYSWLCANNCKLVGTKYVCISARQNGIVERDGGVELPAVVLESEDEFQRNVIKRMVSYISTPEHN